MQLLRQGKTKAVSGAHLEGEGCGSVHLPLTANDAVWGRGSVQLACNLHGEGGGLVQLEVRDDTNQRGIESKDEQKRNQKGV